MAVAITEITAGIIDSRRGKSFCVIGINVFGVIEGFLLNSYIVFGQKPKFSTLFKYSTIYAISFVLNLIIMNILVGFMGVSKYLALYPAIVLVTIINYFLIKKFLFKSN